MPCHHVTPGEAGLPAVNCNSQRSGSDPRLRCGAGRLANIAALNQGTAAIRRRPKWEARRASSGAYTNVKIKKLIEERRQGDRAAVRESADPSDAEALAALDQLDGAEFSSIAFVTEDETVMAVGGGAGTFVVSITLDDDARIYTLIDPSRSEDHDEDVVVGGQSGSYQQYQCVSRELAAAAILYFQQEGAPSPELKWVSE